jgi:MFS family permease
MNLEQVQRLGRWNVAVSFVTWMFIVVMPASLMPILYVPIMDDTGWSRGQVTAFSSFKFGAGALVAFFMGHIIDRLGLRTVMLASFTAVGLSVASLFLVHSLWTYYLAGAVLGSAILGSTVGVKVLISRWFSTRMGAVMGLALAGAGVAGVLIPPSTTMLNGLIGWRWTALAMSSTVFALLIPLFVWKARVTPSAYGFTAEQLDPPKEDAKATRKGTDDQPQFKDLLGMRTFWIVFAAHVIIGAVDHAMLDHLPLYIARDAKLGLTVAAWGFTIITAAGALGKIGFGWLFDRFSVKAVSLCWASMAIGIALAFPVSGLFTFALFTIAQGASHGGVMVEAPICAKHVFGLRSLSKTIGMLGAANSLGAAIATGGVGFLHDATHSYTLAFMLLMGLALIAAAMLYRVKPVYWPRWQEKQTSYRRAAVGEPA